MRERRFWRKYLFVFHWCLSVAESGCRRLPAFVSEFNNGKTVANSITVVSNHLYILCDCLCFRWVDQSEKFPLFILIMADTIRKQMQEIALGIQDEVINLPVELWDEAINETRFSLIAKPVNPKKQNLRAMLNALPRLWGVGDEVVGRILENRKVQFLFQSEEAMTSILKRGPWSFNDWMCVLQKWTTIHTEADLKHIPFWVQIRGIPLRYLTLRMITYIGNQMGSFMETDFGGDGAVLVDYVRVRLLWNIEMPLRFQRIFQFGDETCVLKFRYEKLRNFCTICGLLTHDMSDCPSNINPIQDAPADDDDGDDTPPDVPDDDREGNGSATEATHEDRADKEDEPQASFKKRKTEMPQASSSTYPTFYCDMRQAYATEDEQQCMSKRKRRESEVLKVRNWFFLAANAPCSNATNQTSNPPTTPNINRDGTVGQKPPEEK